MPRPFKISTKTVRIVSEIMYQILPHRRTQNFILSSIFFTALFTVTIFSLKYHSTEITNQSPVSYAIYSAHTPNGEGFRAFDYAFYLPLTALTWERIGYVSYIIIIGSECEWENDPTLRVILSYLKERKAIVSFVPTALEYRMMISQTVRIFGANMEDFPGKADDYLITSDADQWPITKSFFDRPKGKDLVLIHADCCGDFIYKDVKYRMYPMGNIGATVSTWRQIINSDLVRDAESILDYFEEEFGPNVRNPVKHASAEWYFDQKLVSVRIAQWIQRYGSKSVIEVTDRNFTRVDRSNWDDEPLYMTQEELQWKYDAHLPLKMYLPEVWNDTLPLLKLMFGEDSWQFSWSNNYVKDFYATVRNYVEFND